MWTTHLNDYGGGGFQDVHVYCEFLPQGSEAAYAFTREQMHSHVFVLMSSFARQLYKPVVDFVP